MNLKNFVSLNSKMIQIAKCKKQFYNDFYERDRSFVQGWRRKVFN